MFELRSIHPMCRVERGKNVSDLKEVMLFDVKSNIDRYSREYPEKSKYRILFAFRNILFLFEMASNTVRGKVVNILLESSKMVK